MSLDLYKEDLDKHVNGSPCYAAQMTFYVVRFGTKEAQKQIIEIKEKLYGIFPNPNEIDESEVIANWIAYYGVVGWDDVTDGETEEVMLYSKAFARQLFLNKAYWLSLNQVIITHALNFENYLSDETQKDTEQIKKP